MQSIRPLPRTGRPDVPKDESSSACRGLSGRERPGADRPHGSSGSQGWVVRTASALVACRPDGLRLRVDTLKNCRPPASGLPCLFGKCRSFAVALFRMLCPVAISLVRTPVLDHGPSCLINDVFVFCIRSSSAMRPDVLAAKLFLLFVDEWSLVSIKLLGCPDTSSICPDDPEPLIFGLPRLDRLQSTLYSGTIVVALGRVVWCIYPRDSPPRKLVLGKLTQTKNIACGDVLVRSFGTSLFCCGRVF